MKFLGKPWFAWYPVVVSDGGHRRLAWLETVWRDELHAIDGTVTVRHYAN